MFEKAEPLKENAFYVDVNFEARLIKTLSDAVTRTLAKEMLDFMTRINYQYNIQHQEFWAAESKPESIPPKKGAN